MGGLYHCDGHTIKKLCERAYNVFNEVEFERLSSISVSHLYNLRKSTTYCRTRDHFEKTKPKKSLIGEQRKPQPNGQPGYIRIDTVHQGDQDKKKGVYHINAVDEVTQFEVVATVEKSVNNTSFLCWNKCSTHSLLSSLVFTLITGVIH